MTMDPDSAGTQCARVDANSFDALVDLLYHDLRNIARRERYRARAGLTLCTTALVNEAWIKLQRSHRWDNRQHFLATAALAMRQVLVNDVLARRAAKRNHGESANELQHDIAAQNVDDEQILLVNDAIKGLAALSPRLAQVVECRYFAGFSDGETAEALGITDRTVRRDWLKARAWLYRELGEVAPLQDVGDG